ncbi:MAG: membrane protein insertase YidC [Nocardioidaceae bacterium]
MFDLLGTVIMDPLYWVISVILVGWHRTFSLVFGAESGWAWALAIVGLTVTIRAALIPLFVKQIKSSRNMQLIQPKVKELQKKYGHDRERLAQETMQLYKDTKTNPFASCLPLIIQMPIFLALFRLLNAAARGDRKGILSAVDVKHLSEASIFGAKISDTFTGTEDVTVRILAGVLVIAMTATTFLTQRQLMSKNMPADAMSGPYAQQQKMLLYVLPVVFAVGGIAFPIGVLLYWTTSNLWTMSQQFYVIRNNPAPGTPAFAAKQQRDHARGRSVTPDPLVAAAEEDTAPPPPPRQQPKKQSREQRKKQTKPRPNEQGPMSSRDDVGEPDAG